MKTDMSNVVVGLDIGTTKIACFVGMRNEHGKIEILAMGQVPSVGVARGVVENIEKTTESIKNALEQTQSNLKDDHKRQIKKVYVGVAGHHIKSIQHRGMITRNDIETEISQVDIDSLEEVMFKTKMPPGEQIITVIPKQYIIDNQQGIKDPIGHAGIRLEANFHIITGNIGSCSNIVRCAKRAGVEVEQLILEPMASAQAVLSEEEKEAGVVLVDIGGGTTDIAIFYDGIIQHTAIIPFGGNIITEDIKEGCKILYSHAEQLKMRFGSALPSESQENEIVGIPGLRGRPQKEISVRKLAGIINARMVEIIDLIDYEIMISGLKKKLIGGVVITGGGAELKHLKQLFEHITHMDTRVGYPTEHLTYNPDRPMDALVNPMYSTGIGLVLKGFEDIDKKSNSGENSTEEIAQEVAKKRNLLFDFLLKKANNLFLGDELNE